MDTKLALLFLYSGSFTKKNDLVTICIFLIFFENQIGIIGQQLNFIAVFKEFHTAQMRV